MSTDHLLIVDDEPDLLSGLQRLIGRHLPKLRITTCGSGGEALERAATSSFSAALIDLQMPEMNGLDLLERLQKLDPRLTVVLMTAYGSIETAVAAMKRGAYDFLAKPLDREMLLRTLDKALERNRLLRENTELRRQAGDRSPLAGLIGQSPAMRRLHDGMRTAAATDYTVLVRGESGTGKELVARALHDLSPRRSRPFVMVNCPAIPEHLLESELFGHRRGAFTNADRDRRGLFEEADGGTICLDEMGDIPVSVQTKLLRVLQDQEIRALGESRTKKVDVRVIACTNRNLEEMISDGRFRDDLFYRLHVITLRTPPLREMREDIPLLAEHFALQTCAELDLPRRRFSAGALEELGRRDWPGNVRELQNAVRRAIIFCPGDEVGPLQLSGLDESGYRAAPLSTAGPRPDSSLEPYKAAKEKLLASFTEEYLSRLLAATDGNVTRAAEISGLTRTALQKILRRSDIPAKNFRKEEEG